MIATVAALGVIAVSTDEPVTYMVFPALIWAAFRFGPPGATLSIAIAAGVAIGVTAHDVGPFFKQPIDHRTLSTQVYIAVAALTTLFLSAIVSERERSAAALAEAKQHEGERAVEERHRIARDLHDSVSQALFSTVLHTRAAQKALEQEGSESVGTARDAAERDRRPDQERAERDARPDLRAGTRSRSRTGSSRLSPSMRRDSAPPDGLTIEVHAPGGRLLLSQRCRDAALRHRARGARQRRSKHAGASTARGSRRGTHRGRCSSRSRDDGRGFDPAARHPGHFGLESMRSRAARDRRALTITSAPRTGHRRPRRGRRRRRRGVVR